MHRNRDLTAHRDALMQDLERTRLLEAMAQGDQLLFDVARQAVLTALDEPEGRRSRRGRSPGPDRSAR